MSRSNRISLVGIVIIGLLGTGCLVGGSSSVKRSGTYVADSTLNRIEPGKTEAAWVMATLGQPNERTELETGHELWKYSYKETRDSSGYIFLIFGGSDRKVTDGRAFVEIKDGVVVKAWRG
jgi:hypothetical protein